MSEPTGRWTPGPAALTLLIWAIAAAFLIAREITNAAGVPLLADTDDAMRLAQVHDLLAGQSWFDTVQHRLDPPEGATIHWSRLVDAPIAALILILRPVLGSGADMVAVFAWPLLLLGVLLVISVALTRTLLGRDGVLPALVLPLLSSVVMIEFAPGRIDHHNVQIILTAFMALAALRALDRPIWAAFGGVVAAAALAIGTESLPIVAAAIAGAGLSWLVLGKATLIRNFGLAFAAGTALICVATLPPTTWMAPACDAMSLTYLAAALVGGGVLAFLPYLPVPDSQTTRAIRLVGGGGVVLVILVVLFPDCLAGPFAGLDPWLRENWLPAIAEAKPVWVSLTELPAYTFSVVLPPLIGILALVLRLIFVPEDRGRWALIALFLLAATLVTLLQVRGARLAAILVVPAGAWAILAARRQFLMRKSILTGTLLIGAWLTFTGVVPIVAVNAVNAMLAGNTGSSATAPSNEISLASSRSACFKPESFAPLKALAPTVFMAPSDLGAHLIAFTAHATYGAPYHRNERGLTDALRFFNDEPEVAREIARRRGFDHVAVCAALPEIANGLSGRPDDAFGAVLATGQLPDGFSKTGDQTGPIRLYRFTLPED